MNIETGPDTVQYPQTKFFQVCRGVFEGGGCRGAGHVGAYEAAVKCGVNFSEVAGTSAGSIVAALIGAGASPEFLLEKCAFLKFSELLAKPKNRISPLFGWRWLNRLASSPLMLLGKQKRLLRKILLVNGSAYSSAQLEDWLDGLLAELLPDAPRPIRFEKLVLPTWIVAADLSGKSNKVWSKRDTPSDKVAMAVRSSCSIPLFFEPVESGNSFLVDGGILSNLPAFVFAGGDRHADSLGGRILAFRLVAQDDPKTEWTLSWLLPRLIDTMISGATDLQTQIQSRISYVEINTGKVSGTDFDISKENVTFLLDEGKKAMTRFVQTEHAKLNDSLESDVARYSEDELYDDLVREMSTPGIRFVACCANTEWFWRLFPSVAHWMFNGARIDVLTKPTTGNSKAIGRERQRRSFLEKMGARIVEDNDSLPNCFILSRTDDRHNAAFIRDISESQYSPAGVVYLGIKHRVIIQTLLDKVSSHFGTIDRHIPKLTLTECDAGPLIELLKNGVHQYNESSVAIEIREVSLCPDSQFPTDMIVGRIRSFKYRQIAFLASLYNIYQIPFCLPAEIRADGEPVSTITPPVLEDWNNRLVALEGNTRLFYCHRMRRKTLWSLVAKGVTGPLPGHPVRPPKAVLATSHISSEDGISGFKYDYFRAIESAARPIHG